MALLEEEIDLFNNQPELAKRYPNSFLVIKRQQVYGGFPSIAEAYASALEKFEVGTFLVIKTLPPTSFTGSKIPAAVGRERSTVAFLSIAWDE